MAPVPELNGAGVVAVVVLSPPFGSAFAVPDVRLLGDSVELSAPVVLVVVVDPDAPEEDPLPLFEGEVVVLAARDALLLDAGAVVDGIGIDRVVFVVVVPDEVVACV